MTTVKLPMRRKGDITKNRLNAALAFFALVTWGMLTFTAYEAWAKISVQSVHAAQ